ncbi:MAG: hypothetical protein GY816_11700 [Cytophagales bacterium]|nr:hypothetical protein [Cytophagales bacterium]
MFQLLMKGVFSVNKTGRTFGAMPTDQNHEQENKELKGSGGISDLLNTSGSLERFLVSGPIITQLIHNFETSFGETIIDFDTLNHHSESKPLQKRFSEERDNLLEEMKLAGNPFSDYVQITSLVSKVVSKCSQQIYEIEQLGIQLLQILLKTFFIDKTSPIHDPIKQNNIGFF